MALIFAEHCDNWTSNTHVTARGWVQNNTFGGPSSTGGVAGGGAIFRSLYTDNYDRSYYRDLTGVTATRVHSAFWWKCDLSGSSASYSYFINRVTAGGNACGIKSRTNNTNVALLVPTAASGTEVGTSTTNIMDNGWHYLEFEILLDTAFGTARLWVDGALEVTFAGATASAAAPLAITRWYVGPHASNGYQDDLLLWTDVDTGDGWTTNLAGGVRILKTVRPTSDAAVQFTPSTGVDNYALVDEQALSTSDHVESGTDGHSDRYGFAAHGLTEGTPHGVIVETVASNPGAGAINVVMVAESDAVVADGVAKDVPGSSTVFQHHFPARPGGGAWSFADIDAATFGIKVDVP